jgi:hypothetical protein
MESSRRQVGSLKAGFLDGAHFPDKRERDVRLCSVDQFLKEGLMVPAVPPRTSDHVRNRLEPDDFDMQ